MSKANVNFRNFQLKSVQSNGLKSSFNCSYTQFKLDFFNKRIFYDLNESQHYFYCNDFSNIKKIEVDSTNCVFKIEFNKNGDLFFINKINLNFKEFKGSIKDIKKVGLSDKQFNFNNKVQSNMYLNRFNAKIHEIQLSIKCSNRIQSILSFLNESIGQNLNEEIVNNCNLKRKREDDEQVPSKKKSRDLINACFERNRENFAKDQKIMIKLPCNHQVPFEVNISDLLFETFTCKVESCKCVYKYSFCLKKLVISLFTQHCIHTNNCQLFTKCKECEN